MSDQMDKKPNDQREDDVSRDRLNEIQKRYESWSRRTVLILLVLFTVQLALGGLSVYLLNENNQRVERDCLNSNKRHDDSIRALRAGSDIDQKNAPTEAAKAEIRRRRDVTISLIDALSPKTEDCSK